MRVSSSGPRFSPLQVGAQAASWLAILFGGLVLAGWFFRVPALRTFGGNLTVDPNTALSFALAGFALALLGREPASRKALRLAQALAFVVTGLAAVTVSEYMLGWDAGIHPGLFRAADAGKTLSERPTVLTAINFLLFGAALLLLDVKVRGSRPADLFIVTPLLISLLGVIGYACKVPVFYGWQSLLPNTSMALPTVTAFIVLGAGMLCARPDGGLMEVIVSRTSSGLMARRLLLAPVLIPLVIGWLELVGLRIGVYNAEFAMWLFAFLNIFVFTLIIWWCAQLFHRGVKVRQQAEEELQQLNTELEQRVNERTVEVSQTLAALRESEGRLRQVLDTALDAVILADDKGAVISWNREAERIFGWTQWQILGQSLSATIIPAPNREAHERGLRHFLATQEGRFLNKRVEITALRKDGMEFPVELAITPIRMGDTFTFSAFVRDITERKRVEAALANERNLLRTLIDNIPAYIYLKDTAGRYMVNNQANLRAIKAESEAATLGKTVFDFFPEAYARAFDADDRQVLTTGQPVVEREVCVDNADGSCNWILTTKLPLHDAQGQITGLLGISHDITTRKQAEAELRQSEARFRIMADRAPVLIWMSGPDKLCTWFNQVWLDFVGRPLEKEVGNGWAENVHPDDFDRCLKTYVTSVDARQPFEMEYRLRRHDGEYRWILHHGVPLGPPGGLFAGYIGSCIDVTERKQALEKIRELNIELEQRVRQRTTQLEAANSELEAFSYSVSHDLRAPLRHISGYVEMLREDLEPVLAAQNTRHLEVITGAAKQMGSLIENLLSFSRAGRTEMHGAHVNMDELVGEVLNELRPETKDRDIFWDLAPLPEVFGDRALLKQVWLNLLSNAIKYTRKRSRAEIRIGTEMHPDEVEFQISDNGAGFDMKFANKLFGVFQRLHLAEEFEGTGIGLANVRRVVARHGGRTWAKGEVDGGATFYFTLPRLQNEGRYDPGVASHATRGI